MVWGWGLKVTSAAATSAAVALATPAASSRAALAAAFQDLGCRVQGLVGVGV